MAMHSFVFHVQILPLRKGIFLNDLLGPIFNLLEIEIERIIPFLPVTLNQLFMLLPCSPTDEMALSTLGTLIGIIDKISASGQNHLLRTFVIYYFQSPAVKSKSNSEDETVHSALCKYITSHVNSPFFEFLFALSTEIVRILHSCFI
ncbi:unnamed protein product [Onchocerca flexuosa]|uniref:Ipi1_N domain-containing protein n=1 Tax=Onchocerca flexuosa TaxID=387005 RepID=A0A183HP42_9BILA|nr:unnamed protein product [Onchocerca flexuosa]